VRLPSAEEMPSLERLDAELARRSLAEFVRQAWRVIEPGTELIWNWHLDVICDHVQALLEGRLAKRNLLINVPPGSMKSTIVSVCAPAWWWIHKPSWRGIFASGNEGVALRDSIKCRDILDSDWYRRLFAPPWGFAKDQNAKGHYKNTSAGFRKALSAGAKVTGDRADAIIIDDPLDAAEAYSKPARDAVINWWDNAMANRLSDLRTGIRCVIMQRLHEEDLAGHVLGMEPEDWEVLVIRQEYEKPGPKDPDRTPTSLGWTDPRTEEGELFFPVRFPPEVVEGERRRLASSGYAGQHQQRPTAKEGEIFKKGFVQWFKPEDPPTFSRTILSWDTAFKEGEENDYTVCLVMGQGQRGVYLLDRVKDRMSYPDLKEKAKTMGDRWRPTAFLVEDKASGQSLIQELKRDTSLPVVAIKVDRDKQSRAHAVTPTWEAGKIFVPEGAEWVDDFLTHLYGFPKMAHDDDVDGFTQGVTYLVAGGGSVGLLDWIQQEAAVKAEAERQAKEEQQQTQGAA